MIGPKDSSWNNNTTTQAEATSFGDAFLCRHEDPSFFCFSGNGEAPFVVDGLETKLPVELLHTNHSVIVFSGGNSLVALCRYVVMGMVVAGVVWG